MPRILQLPSLSNVGDLIYGNYDVVAFGNNATMGVKENESILPFECFLGYTRRGTARTVTQRMEYGGFTSINKVLEPKTVEVQMAVQASILGLGNYINWPGTLFKDNAIKLVEQWQEGFNEFGSQQSATNDWRLNILTPSKTYVGYSLNDVYFGIPEGGSPSLIVIGMKFDEIRERTVMALNLEDAITEAATPSDDTVVQTGMTSIITVF